MKTLTIKSCFLLTSLVFISCGKMLKSTDTKVILVSDNEKHIEDINDNIESNEYINKQNLEFENLNDEITYNRLYVISNPSSEHEAFDNTVDNKLKSNRCYFKITNSSNESDTIEHVIPDGKVGISSNMTCGTSPIICYNKKISVEILSLKDTVCNFSISSPKRNNKMIGIASKSSTPFKKLKIEGCQIGSTCFESQKVTIKRIKKNKFIFTTTDKKGFSTKHFLVQTIQEKWQHLFFGDQEYLKFYQREILK